MGTKFTPRNLVGVYIKENETGKIGKVLTAKAEKGEVRTMVRFGDCQKSMSANEFKIHTAHGNDKLIT